MKRNLKFLSLLFSLITVFFITSCSERVMGYSVVLWNIPEQNIQSGDIVPVYIKSNISHVYVIGNHGGEKVEVPLWRLTEPVKKRKVKAVLNKYSENAHTYASVKLDGLPCRAEAVNTAKQVYRLRKGEIIKILYKGKGQAPMVGKEALKGDWYKILTDDGTSGWCFSYNLNLYETDEKGERIGGNQITEEESVDDSWDVICSQIWYPDYFRSMIDTKIIDLSLFHLSYKFQIDVTNKKINLNTSKVHQVWDFNGYLKTGENEYSLNDVPVKIIYKNQNFIIIRYTDDSGKPQDLNFVPIDENINDIIAEEKERRSQSYRKIFMHGPEFVSSSYGELTFNDDGSFKWTGFKLLVPFIIAGGTKNSGSASVKYSLSKSLSSSFDGVLTLKFDGMQKEVNFLYKIEDGALRLEDTSSAVFKGNQVKERGSSPIVIYFKKN